MSPCAARLRGILVLLLGAGVAMSAAGCDESAGGTAATAQTAPTPVPKGGTERPAKLIFGLTPYLSPDEMRAEFRPLAEYLGRAVGLPADVRVAADYTQMAKLLDDFEVHVGAMSPFSYVHARRDNPALILIGTHIADGSSTYSAYLITHEKSGIKTVGELRGKRFGFVDRRSASGYLYPLAYLRNLGYEPETFFSSLEFAGNHPALIERVVAGKLDGGATFSTAYKNAKDEGLRILAKTGRIPYDAYCASPRLDRGMVESIRAALLKVSTRTDAGRRVLGHLTNINGFVSVADDHYDEVRRVARLVEQTNAPSP